MWVCCWPSKERGQGRPVVGDAGLQLDRWANFYVITSTAAVTLVGLLFVVITLAAGRASVSDAGKIRVYLTPTVVYLASVLYFAAVLTFPLNRGYRQASAVASGVRPASSTQSPCFSGAAVQVASTSAKTCSTTWRRLQLHTL